ncbi:MAG: hypothetical protein J6Y29_02535 [Clostridiales bacterium]|nr:hypothetical protein [Clostridiales bacterium]
MNRALNYCMFQEEDKGFNIYGDISGYVKILVNKPRFRINVTVFNINSNFSYQVYIMKSINGGLEHINMGNLLLKRNMGTLEYEFLSPDKDILNFDVIAVVSLVNDGADTKILAPAVAYKNEKILWRDKLLESMKKNMLYACSKGCPLMCNTKIMMTPNFPKNQIPFSKEIFKRQVDINFRKCNPFLNKRKDYMWWSVTDVNKLYYFLKLFGIDIRDKISADSDNMILGIYEDRSKIYIVLGFLTDDVSDKRYDKIAKVADLNVRYGLIFINPYIA